MKNFSDKHCRENQNTFYVRQCPTSHPTPENRSVCEISWINMIRTDRPQMKIRRIPRTCWVNKNTEVHSEYATRIAVPKQMKLRKPSLVLMVKWSRYRPGVAQRVGRAIALLFHDCGTTRGWVVSSTPRPHFTPGKDPVPILQEAGWVPGPVWTDGKSRPHRDSIPDRPFRSSVAIPTELPGPPPQYYVYNYFNCLVFILFGEKFKKPITVVQRAKACTV